MPWPSEGNEGSMGATVRGGPLPARPASVLLLGGLDFLAALLRAVFLRHLDDALALAGVLAGARITGARTPPLALARVDPGAPHHVAAGLLVRRAGDATGEDQTRRRRRENHSLR